MDASTNNEVGSQYQGNKTGLIEYVDFVLSKSRNIQTSPLKAQNKQQEDPVVNKKKEIQTNLNRYRRTSLDAYSMQNFQFQSLNANKKIENSSDTNLPEPGSVDPKPVAILPSLESLNINHAQRSSSPQMSYQTYTQKYLQNGFATVQQAKNIANEPLIKLKNMNEQNEGGQDHKNEQDKEELKDVLSKTSEEKTKEDEIKQNDYRLKSKEQALIDKRNAFRRPEYKKLYSITSDFTVLLDQIKDQKDVLNVVKEEEPVQIKPIIPQSDQKQTSTKNLPEQNNFQIPPKTPESIEPQKMQENEQQKNSQKEQPKVQPKSYQRLYYPNYQHYQQISKVSVDLKQDQQKNPTNQPPQESQSKIQEEKKDNCADIIQKEPSQITEPIYQPSEVRSYPIASNSSRKQSTDTKQDELKNQPIGQQINLDERVKGTVSNTVIGANTTQPFSFGKEQIQPIPIKEQITEKDQTKEIPKLLEDKTKETGANSKVVIIGLQKDQFKNQSESEKSQSYTEPLNKQQQQIAQPSLIPLIPLLKDQQKSISVWRKNFNIVILRYLRTIM